MAKHPDRPASGTGSAAATKNAAKSGRKGDRERDVLHRVRGPVGTAPRVKPKPERTPGALIAEAEALLGEGRAEDALPVAKKALKAIEAEGGIATPAALPALNMIASINLELGNADSARTHFLQAVTLDPDGLIPEAQGGGAEKFLWLAQLSEEGGQDSVDWFSRGASVLRTEIAQLSSSSSDDDDATGKEKRKKLAEALCGVIEVYMTDLSWESSAESKCEALITESLLVAPLSAEPLQTLASIRISQSRIGEARKALADSIELWQDLPPEDISVPDFPTRISLARLLMEVKMEEEALGVVERLVGEDDGSVEAWYLGGWCLYLLAQKTKTKAKTNTNTKNQNQNQKQKKKNTKDETTREEEEEDTHTASLLSSREWLRQSLQLCEMQEYEDERLREHARELVAGLDGELGEEGGGEDGEEEGEGEDQEMDGT
ncbi:hypothetical protein MMC28_005013 [Mycoblastus sanguinarius]|nr:hypothetical protein [Mycoblastus sanguinarius]